MPDLDHGTLPNGDEVKRQTTGVSDLKRAEALRSAWLAEHARSIQSDAINGPSIVECIGKYLASREHELSSETHKQNKFQLDRFYTFAQKHNVLYMRDLNLDLLESFRVEGLPSGLSEMTKATAISKLRCFLRYAYNIGWITDPLSAKMRPHYATCEAKQPYSDKEVECILREAPKSAMRSTGLCPNYPLAPDTCQLLLKLLLATGMRVVGQFQIQGAGHRIAIRAESSRSASRPKYSVS